MPLSFRHLTTTQQLTRADVDEILRVAAEMDVLLKNGGDERLKGKILASLFYEPSTRTRLSFESAMHRLGGSVITVNGIENTSLKKGETLEDTIRMVCNYADIIVMRHPKEGSVARVMAVSSKPLINGGDGPNEHPTQGLIDLYTIQKERGRLDDLHVAFACDPLHSRTIRALAMLLCLYQNIRLTFISPKSLQMSDSLRAHLQKAGVAFTETEDLSAGLTADVLYMNRLQEERFADHAEFERLRHDYVLTAAMLTGRDATIMDPLPRIDEIATDVDLLPTAAYFRQAANGVPVRMALLSMLLGA